MHEVETLFSLNGVAQKVMHHQNENDIKVKMKFEQEIP